MADMADENELEAIFASARRQDVPSADLSAHVLAAGVALQPRERAVAISALPARPARADGFWAEIGAAIAGWRAAGGLSAAVALGFWLGVSDPSGLLDRATTADSVELMPGAEDLIASQVDEG